MPKKDFEAFARILSDQLFIHNSPETDCAIERIAANMADYFETQNPRFDRNRFLQACGV